MCPGVPLQRSTVLDWSGIMISYGRALARRIFCPDV